jgi:threonine-phosphate decarboxylase
MLKKSNLIENIYPSSANFVMVKLKDIEAKTFLEKLIPHKIMIRNCANFDFLDENFIRIAIKDITSLRLLENIL